MKRDITLWSMEAHFWKTNYRHYGRKILCFVLCIENLPAFPNWLDSVQLTDVLLMLINNFWNSKGVPDANCSKTKGSCQEMPTDEHMWDFKGYWATLFLASFIVTDSLLKCNFGGVTCSYEDFRPVQTGLGRFSSQFTLKIFYMNNAISTNAMAQRRAPPAFWMIVLAGRDMH